MDPDFWHECWAQNDTRFHQSQINLHLQSFWADLGVAPGARVLVPLCGKSRDLLWLRAQGHEVLGLRRGWAGLLYVNLLNGSQAAMAAVIGASAAGARSFTATSSISVGFGIGLFALLQLDDNANALAVALVANVGNALELLRLHQFRKLRYEVAGSLVELTLPCSSATAFVEEMAA